MIALQLEIEHCYETEPSKFYCIYLDLAARRLALGFAETLHIPPDEFFADDKLGSRIAPVLREANMDLNAMNRYLAMLNPGIDALVEERLTTWLKDAQTGKK